MMASGVFAPLYTLSPPQTFLFELLIGSTVVGFTGPESVVRPLSLPVLWGCVHQIATAGSQHLRPRWASLFGGASAIVFFHYIDLAVIRKWSYESAGPARSYSGQQVKGSIKKEDRVVVNESVSTHVERQGRLTGVALFLHRLKFGWNQMWALRHVNTEYEVKNVPAFSSNDPSYVPSRGWFVLRETAIAAVCYLVMDLMGQRQPPSPERQAQIFDRALIPVFRRLGEVTKPQLKLRALSIFGFAINFWCIVRGMFGAAGAIAVSLGLSEPKNWRPPFGSISDAYSIANLWGKVWHQNLRGLVSAPAKLIVGDFMRLPLGTLAGRTGTLLLSFIVSGCVHQCAGVAGGMDKLETGVMQFFVTQAFGIVVEEAVQTMHRRLLGRQKTDAPPSPLERTVGYLWVAAFMTWSGPAWLYPQASKPPTPGVPQGFLPFSVVKVWKGSNRPVAVFVGQSYFLISSFLPIRPRSEASRQPQSDIYY